MLKPTAVFNPFGPRVEIRCFGTPFDWNLGNLRENEGGNDEANELYNHLSMIAAEAIDYTASGGATLLAPNPSLFNAEICQPDQLQRKILYSGHDLIVCRGATADGCEVPPGQGFWISTADCPTVVAYSPVSNKVVAAHAGRDCLWDRKKYVDGLPPRRHSTVITAILDQFPHKERGGLRVFITCGIAPDHFEHRIDDPQYGKVNITILRHLETHEVPSNVDNFIEGQINLFEIIKRQFLTLGGVKSWNIGRDCIDTYGDRDADGNYLYHSNRRGTTAEEKTRRNGVLVVHHR